MIGKMDTYTSYANYAKYSKIDLEVSRVYSILNRESDSLQLRLVDSNNRTVVSSGEFSETDLSPLIMNQCSRNLGILLTHSKNRWGI